MTAYTTIPTEAASRTRPPPLACGSCGKTYGESAWRSLRALERIEAPEMHRLVSRWPEGFVIEVRGCTCGRPIAAKRPRE
jgi:DNA-directed RNA polymerase subunit N (RpoN/RPB10)